MLIEVSVETMHSLSNYHSVFVGNWMIIILLGVYHLSLGSLPIYLTCRFCNLDLFISEWFQHSSVLSYWCYILAEMLLTTILKGPSLIILAHVQILTVCKHLTLICYSWSFNCFWGTYCLFDLMSEMCMGTSWMEQSHFLYKGWRVWHICKFHPSLLKY